MNKQLLFKKIKVALSGIGLASCMLSLNLEQAQAQLSFSTLISGDAVNGTGPTVAKVLNITSGTGPDYFKPSTYPLHIAADNEGNVVFGYAHPTNGPMMVRVDKNSTKAVLFGNVGQEVRSLALDKNNAEYLYIAKVGSGNVGAIERAVWKNTYTELSIGYYSGFDAGTPTTSIKTNIGFLRSGDKVFMDGNNDASETLVLGTVRGMTFDNNGNLFYADMDNHVIRKVSMIHHQLSFSVNTGSDITLMSVTGVKVGQLVSGVNIATGTYVGAINGNVVSLVDVNGNPYSISADLEPEVRISFVTGVEHITGTAGSAGNELKSTAALSTVNFAGASGTQNAIGMAFDNLGNLFFTERNNLRVTKIHAVSGSVSGDSRITAFFNIHMNNFGLACDDYGKLYVADRNGNKILKLSASGDATTVSEIIAGSSVRLIIGNFSVTNGSKTITTTSDVSAILPGAHMRLASFIPANAIVESVNVATKTITMSLAATATGTTLQSVVFTSPDGFVTTGTGANTGHLDGPGGMTMVKNQNGSLDLFYTETLGYLVRKLSNIQLLPVTLAKPFVAKLSASNKVDLSWSTASEQNNSHFIVKRSTDGKSFSSIGTMLSKGDFGATYNFTDFNPAVGVSYYELSQVDNDGKTEVLGLQTVNVSLQAQSIVIYPNPVKNSSFTVSIPAINNKTDLALSVVDLVGRVIYKTSYIKTTDGIYNVKLSSGLKKGVYVVKINGIYNRKITVE